jgi:hypothetical protein
MKQTAIEWLVEQFNLDYNGENELSPSEFIKQAKEMEKQQTEISDEEIEKAALDYDNSVIYGPPLVHFEQGAFWYREQLKSRQ